ncbi:hypothetical protein Trydic_g5462 [Trypoxylus dichotomus]
MDEKRFSLDEPGGFQHYWHDLRKEPKVISRRPQGGGGAMVWGAILHSGAVEIIFIEGSLNAQKYLEIIENVKGVIQNQMGMEDFVLQQDNAPTHNARRHLVIVSQYAQKKRTWADTTFARARDIAARDFENCEMLTLICTICYGAIRRAQTDHDRP